MATLFTYLSVLLLEVCGLQHASQYRLDSICYNVCDIEIIKKVRITTSLKKKSQQF